MTASTAAAVAAFLASKGATRVATGARAMTEGQVYAKTRDAKPKITVLGDAFPDFHAEATEFMAALPMLANIKSRDNYRHIEMFKFEYETAMYNFRKNTPFTSMNKIVAESIKWLSRDYLANAVGVTDEQAEALSAINRKMGFASIW